MAGTAPAAARIFPRGGGPGRDAVLTGYRERGVLRRLNATPVGAGRLLGAQLTVNFAVALTAAAGILIAGYAVVFGMLARRLFRWE